ncbi:MAG: alcohol dehydrogenase catalytic domain-containing protein [Defluviitaleaceae bacterium]|nr:alcohol dehydrogenase catalytic domain-containing protein [Defluviitaleaceae bacterium]
MLQMTLSAPKTITRGEVPEPRAASGQVVIKVVRSGICGSDIHAYYDKHPFISLPIVTGHEFSGTIAEIGEGVSGFTAGNRVTVMPQVFCGECLNCRKGRYNICSTLKVIGCQTPGASQEMLAADAKLVLLLPDGMGFDEGAMLEPVAVGIHACRRAGCVENKKVAVLGAGTIGNLAAQAAKALGAESVMITDISGPRLELAKKCGIEHTVNISERDLAAEIKNLWGGDGADLIIECVGLQSAIDQAINIGRKGSDIVVAGVFGEYASVNMGLVQDKELNLIGTLMYTKEDWLDAMRLADGKRIVLEPLMSARFPLSALGEAFTYIENNKDTALKVLIES